VVFACLTLTHSHAQFYAGTTGITIKSGTALSFENLSLTPSSDLTIAGNSLQKTATALPGKPNGSISRVYRFGTAITFSGTASISYLISELNGNIESDLQILYSLDDGIESPEFTVTTGSIVDQSAHRVSNVIANKSLIVLSASGLIKPLPITLVRFDAMPEGRTAVLNWSTSEETNADRFVIERSIDARHWMQVGSENALSLSRTLQNYSFTDTNVAEGINYYRLKMVDKDESFTYSQIRSVLFSGQDAPFVFPNPAAEKLYLRNIPARDVVTIAICEISGRLLIEGAITAGEGVAIKDLAPGKYVLTAKQANGRQSAHTFIKRQ
jgi:hypothetical protein